MTTDTPERSGGSLPQETLIGLLTDETAPARTMPLAIYDAVRILTRINRWLLYGYVIRDEFDLLARLDAERSVLRLRSEMNREIFGFDV
ncbi:MAG: hypothetical protein WA207_08300 [Candidatus Acidiferrum sp.]